MAVTFSVSSFAHLPTPLKDAWTVLTSGSFLPFNVAHPWFLYFLSLYIFFGWLLSRIFSLSAALTSTAFSVFTAIIRNLWFRLLFLILLFYACFSLMGTSYLLTNTHWKIIPSIFFTYFFFFGLGWIIYRTDTIQTMTALPLLQISAGTLLFLVSSLTRLPLIDAVPSLKPLLASIYSSLLFWGLMAFFLKYFRDFSPWMNLYLIHSPIVSFIPGLMADFSAPAIIKYSITVFSTTAICMVSYKYLVRSTYVGLFLNGRIYPREKTKPLPKQELF